MGIPAAFPRKSSPSTVRSAAVPRKTSPGAGPSRAHPRKTSPGTPPPVVFSRKNSPSTPQNANFGSFFVRRENYFALTPTIRPSRANFSRTGSCDVTTLKPTTPLQPLMQANVKPPSPMLAPKQRPLTPPSPLRPLMQANVKPPSPLQPKTTPKTPISQPQRRQRFQLGLGLREQRRWWFHLRLDLREQR